MRLKVTGKYVLIILSISIISILIVRSIFSNIDDSHYQLSTVLETDFDITVKAVGALDASKSHMVSSAIKGDKGKIIYLVKDGARVNNGDILVKLDPTPFEEKIHALSGDIKSLEAAVDIAQQMVEWDKNQIEQEIRTTEFNLEVAELDIRRLIEGEGPLRLASLKEDMDKAKEDYNRYSLYVEELINLEKKGQSSKSEISLARGKTAELKKKYESAQKKYDIYKKHVLPSLIEKGRAKAKQTEMELGRIRKGSVFKVAKAMSRLMEVQGKLQTARASLRLAQSELKKTIIHAPFSGLTILYETFREGQKRKPRVGDKVWQNQPLLYLPSISSMIVKTKVREIDIHKISVNQKCTIQVDAYPSVLFNGKVTFIGVLASEGVGGSAGEKSFQLTIALEGEDKRLRPGMTARVFILTDRARKVLSVPVQAIFDESGTKYCYLYMGTHFKKVKVSLGRQNEDTVEIISGLNKGNKISLVKPRTQDMG